MYQLS